MKSFKKDNLTVQVYDSRNEMGADSAKDVAAAINEVLAVKDECNMIFAAAPSQNEVLASLAADKSVDFSRVNAFHMDEYIGLDKDAPQGFGNFLRNAIFEKAPFKSVSYIEANKQATEKLMSEKNISFSLALLEICRNYTALLQENPIDIVVMGIGENGHIAFNDPPVADFKDPLYIKPVALDEVCRNQQVNDGCFAGIDEVPTHALTLTVPTLLSGKKLFCIVPAPTKAKAVRDTIECEISTAVPATCLRNHPSCVLYLDPDSSSLLNI